MPKLSYGRQDQVHFRNLKEYYFTLGFLANSKNAELRWEHNEDQGAWGSEGRIHCLIPETKFPPFFRFTAGRGNVFARINCNEYVANLVMNHHFSQGNTWQNAALIRSTVPDVYKAFFDEGLNSSNANGASIKPIPCKNNLTPKTTSSKSVVTRPSTEPLKPQINVKSGDSVTHKAFGVGRVEKLIDNKIYVRFAIGEKVLVFPDAFHKGFLRK